jgi:hypothetical protein
LSASKLPKGAFWFLILFMLATNQRCKILAGSSSRSFNAWIIAAAS